MFREHFVKSGRKGKGRVRTRTRQLTNYEHLKLS